MFSFLKSFNSSVRSIEFPCTCSSTFDLLKTSPGCTWAVGLWEMCVIAKSNCLQWVKSDFLQLILIYVAYKKITRFLEVKNIIKRQ